MRQKFKNLTKLLAMFLLVVFSSCVKDFEDGNLKNNKQIVVKEYPFDVELRAKKENSSFAKISSGLKAVKNLLNSASKGGEDELQIDSTRIKEITKEGITTYTMLIKRQIEKKEYFENLVVQIDNLNVGQAYLIKYTPSKPITYEEIHDSYTFEGWAEKYQYPVTFHGDIITDVESPQLGTIDIGSSTCITVLVCDYGGTTHVAGASCTQTRPALICTPLPPATNLNENGDGEEPNFGPYYSGGGPTSSLNIIVENNNIVTSPVVPIPPNPCDKLIDLVDVNKGNIKPNLLWLISKVNNPTTNIEYGVEFEKNNTTYLNTNTTSNLPNNVGLSYGGDVYGGAHTHTWVGTPIFSYQDLELFNTMYDRADSSNKNEAVFILTCRTSLIPFETSTYALKIDNFQSFTNYLNSYKTDPNPIYAGLNSVDRRTTFIDQQNFKYDNCNGEYEKTFLQNITSAGISLFKASTNLDSWNKLELSTPNPANPTNINVIQSPCITSY